MKIPMLKTTLKSAPASTIATLKAPSREDSKWSETRRTLTGRKRQAKRLEVWQKQGGKCKTCGDVVNMSQFELDHVTPIHLGGGDADENLQCLCIPCHYEKTEKELKALNKVSK